MKSIFLFLVLSLTAFSAPTYKMGLRAPVGWKHGAKFERHPSVQIVPVLPAKFSLADKWGFLPPVRDQKNCGCCWAEATEGAVELSYFWRDGKQLPLSVQEILSCSRAGSCNGGYFNALDYMVKKGNASDVDFPFISGNGRDYACKRGLTPIRKIAGWSYLGDSDTGPTVPEIKSVLLSGIAVPVVVYAENDLMRFKKGDVLTVSRRGNPNHMVIVVGWDDGAKDLKGNVVGAWIVRNSWGKVYGDDGYFKIKYGISAIAEVAAWIKLLP